MWKNLLNIIFAIILAFASAQSEYENYEYDNYEYDYENYDIKNYSDSPDTTENYCSSVRTTDKVKIQLFVYILLGCIFVGCSIRSTHTIVL